MAGTYTETFSLGNQDIKQVLNVLQSWLAQQKIDRRNCLSLSLSIEELLLRWQDHFGEDHMFSFSLGSRFMRPHISISLKGEAVNPIVLGEDDHDWSRRMLEGMGLLPEYSYRGQVNRLSFRLKTKINPSIFKKTLIFASAMLLGLLGEVLFPEHTATLVQEFVSPVRATLLGLIAAVSVPMVFLAVLLGICSSGSASEFSKIGNGMLLGFVGKVFLFTLLIGALIFPLFDLNSAHATFSVDQVSGTLDMLLDIIPQNIVEPFYSGNTLQVIVIAVALGLALLILGDRASEIKTLAEKANAIVTLLMEWVCKLITPIVFLILLETIWGSNLHVLVQLWKPLLVSIAAIFIMPLLRFFWTSKKYGISPAKLLHKLLPSLMIAFSTASSAAAYSEVMDCCQDKLGIDKKVAGFGVPAGTVIFKPDASIYLLVCVFYAAEQFGVACSPVWLLLAWISVSMLAIALPPIPGGAMAGYTVLFHQMGIPAEAIVLAVTLNIFMDRCLTTAAMAHLQIELIGVANRHDLLSRDVLHS